MAQDKPINWANVNTLIALAILVGTEVVGISWAAGWAIGGLLQLPAQAALACQALFVALGFAGLYAFMKVAVRHEPIRV